MRSIVLSAATVVLNPSLIACGNDADSGPSPQTAAQAPSQVSTGTQPNTPMPTGTTGVEAPMPTASVAEPAPMVSPECVGWDIHTAMTGALCTNCHTEATQAVGMSAFIGDNLAGTIEMLKVPATASCVGSGSYVVPGKPEESILLDILSNTYALCTSDTTKTAMTAWLPGFARDNNIQCLTEWIAAGAN